MNEEMNLRDKVLDALREKESVWIRDICGEHKMCYKEVFAIGKMWEGRGIVKVVYQNLRNKLVRGENFKTYLEELEVQ